MKIPIFHRLFKNAEKPVQLISSGASGHKSTKADHGLMGRIAQKLILTQADKSKFILSQGGLLRAKGLKSQKPKWGPAVRVKNPQPNVPAQRGPVRRGN